MDVQEDANRLQVIEESANAEKKAIEEQALEEQLEIEANAVDIIAAQKVLDEQIKIEVNKESNDIKAQDEPVELDNEKQ